MSYEIKSIQRMRLNTESSFCTDGSGTLGNFVDVPFVEGSATAVLETDMLNPEYAQQHLYNVPTKLIGLKRCSLTFKLNLASTGSAASATAVQSPLGEILAAVMGGEDLGVGSTVNDAGAAATDFDVTSATGFSQGSLFGIGAAGSFQARPIKTKASANLLARLNFGSAPSNGATVYAAANYYLTQDPTASMQILLEGAEQTDRFSLGGLQLESMTMELPIGQLPMITFTLKGATWLYGDDTAGVLTGSALGVASYARTSPVHVTGNFYYQTASTVTLPTALPVSQFTYTPHISYVPITSPSGTNTIARWRANRAAPVLDGSFVLPFEDYTYMDDRDAKTLKQLFLQIGSTAGSTVCIDVPQAQILNVTTEGGDAIRSQTVSWEAQVDAITSGTTDLPDSPFRIGLT